MISKELYEHDVIRRRMEQIIDILTGTWPLEDHYRADLQREYRQLETRLEQITGVKIIWIEESQSLLWIENGRPVKGLAGPVAKEKFEKIKSIVKPYTHEESNV